MEPVSCPPPSLESQPCRGCSSAVMSTSVIAGCMAAERAAAAVPAQHKWGWEGLAPV